MIVSLNNGRVNHSEKGLLTPNNCVVTFIDHQPQMLFGTSNFDRQSIINNTVALAKATRIFDVPVVLTTVCGLWTETCAALPTVQAIHDGYEIYVVEDCCGDVSQLAHDNAMRRVIQAGANPVTALSVTLEWQRDWAQRDTYDAVMDLVKNHYGAYGIGVEYAYTMVHGAPATRFPEYSVPQLAAGGPNFSSKSAVCRRSTV
ncbi:MAG: isochorismatase family protein [Acidobacteriaceae bacterium]|nr:isochorismatase family protein [Acidobacteriaceae bacterium]